MHGLGGFFFEYTNRGKTWIVVYICLRDLPWADPRAFVCPSNLWSPSMSYWSPDERTIVHLVDTHGELSLQNGGQFRIFLILWITIQNIVLNYKSIIMLYLFNNKTMVHNILRKTQTRSVKRKMEERNWGGGGGLLDAFVSSFFSSYIFDSTSLTWRKSLPEYVERNHLKTKS